MSQPQKTGQPQKQNIPQPVKTSPKEPVFVPTATEVKAAAKPLTKMDLDILAMLRNNEENVRQWMRRMFKEGGLPGWENHPFAELIQIEKRAIALATSPSFVAKVLRYYEKSSDRSAFKMSWAVAAHAYFAEINKFIEGL